MHRLDRIKVIVGIANLRGVLTGVTVVLAAAAWAASPEESYIAARDHYIAKFRALDDARQVNDSALKAHDQAYDDLQKKMRAIIGPMALKGLATTGTLNLSTLFPSDQGFGMLDGLVYVSADDKTRIIVTTESLFAIWLLAHKKWWGDNIDNIPQDAGEALASDAFYTQATGTDAAVMSFAQIPVRKPVNAKVTFAMLAARSQDNSPPTPDEIYVALVQSGRVFVANAPVQHKFDQVPACDDVRRNQEKGADDAYALYLAGDKKDEKLLDQYTELRQEADTLFLRCFAEHAPTQEAFAVAVIQTQSLLDDLPLR